MNKFAMTAATAALMLSLSAGALAASGLGSVTTMSGAGAEADKAGSVTINTTMCALELDDHSQGDVKDGVPMQPSYEQQDEIFQRFVERYPNLKCIARHVRYAHSGSENSLKAFMWYDGHTFESKLFTFTILDRVGGGDAFASGLIYAMLHDYKPMDMLNFAVASSVIKHTIHGDANITDDVSSIRNLMNMNYDIRR